MPHKVMDTICRRMTVFLGAPKGTSAVEVIWQERSLAILADFYTEHATEINQMGSDELIQKEALMW